MGWIVIVLIVLAVVLFVKYNETKAVGNQTLTELRTSRSEKAAIQIEMSKHEGTVKAEVDSLCKFLGVELLKTKLAYEQAQCDARRKIEIAECSYKIALRMHKKRGDFVENMIIHDKGSVSMQWLADQYAQFAEWSGKEVESLLEYRAARASEVVAAERQKRVVAEKSARFYKGLARYYEDMVPMLMDLRDSEDLFIDASAVSREDDSEDPVRKYLTKEEFDALSSVERNQLALDRYVGRKKTRAQIGRDYEAFVGYRYELHGYSVEYRGMIDGVEDLGRDLICKKGNHTQIVQCKRWSASKTIHEKHINQLFGTTVAYAIKNKLKTSVVHIPESETLFPATVEPVFITATGLSDTAREFAKCLGVKVSENKQPEAFPMIKCNVSQRYGERIYHLPFDQQYNKTIVSKSDGEFFAWTVKEAEEKGFRRAFRHWA